LLIVGGLGVRAFIAADPKDAPVAGTTSEESVGGHRDQDEGRTHKVDWSDAEDVVGETTTVCGPVASVIFDGGDTFINVGADYPDPDRFTVIVWNETYRAFAAGDDLCATGQVSEYQGAIQLETLNALADLARA
jgi:hypothetical protein